MLQVRIERNWIGFVVVTLPDKVSGRFYPGVVPDHDDLPKRRPWRTFDDVEYATLQWVDWFNNRRLVERIGNVPPAALEMAYYRRLEVSAMAA